jgi:hypothetical protein
MVMVKAKTTAVTYMENNYNCGHPKTPENTYPKKGMKHGECRECSLQRAAKWRKDNPQKRYIGQKLSRFRAGQ